MQGHDPTCAPNNRGRSGRGQEEVSIPPQWVTTTHAGLGSRSVVRSTAVQSRAGRGTIAKDPIRHARYGPRINCPADCLDARTEPERMIVDSQLGVLLFSPTSRSAHGGARQGLNSNTLVKLTVEPQAWATTISVPYPPPLTETSRYRRSVSKTCSCFSSR